MLLFWKIYSDLDLGPLMIPRICLVMEGFATEEDSSLKDLNVEERTWILPCTDSKQRCFLLETIYCLKIV